MAYKWSNYIKLPSYCEPRKSPIVFFICSTLLASCGSQYTSIVPEDPLFNSQSPSLGKLGKDPDKYIQRNDDVPVSIGNYQPQKNESYIDYKNRIFNTLTLQEYENNKLQQAILKKELNIRDLEQQLEGIQKKHLELRILASNLDPEQNEDLIASSMFKSYRIAEGDTLQKIAFNQIGTHTAWVAIYRFNVEKLPNGPNRLTVGDWLIIPQSNIDRDIKLHKKALDTTDSKS